MDRGITCTLKDAVIAGERPRGPRHDRMFEIWKFAPNFTVASHRVQPPCAFLAGLWSPANEGQVSSETSSAVSELPAIGVSLPSSFWYAA
jgi:hypothetical protein